MLVKVTKKMVSELNKAAKGEPMHFEFCEMPIESYERSVTYDVFRSYDWGDFDDSKSMFKVIRVVYPAEFYAMPNWLTTFDLHKLFCEGMTVSDFTKSVVNAMQI